MTSQTSGTDNDNGGSRSEPGPVRVTVRATKYEDAPPSWQRVLRHIALLRALGLDGVIDIDESRSPTIHRRPDPWPEST
jgi:hypothetical protein